MANLYDAVLKEFYYRDGKLYHMYTKCGRAVKGARAGTTTVEGYRQVRMLGTIYYEHRLIFLLWYGYLPEEVDHINCIKDDNDITNLRDACKSANSCNRGTPKSNTSGVKGVSWSCGSSKWHSQIRYQGRHYHLGYHADIELAELIVQEARSLLHKEFKNDG